MADPAELLDHRRRRPRRAAHRRPGARPAGSLTRHLHHARDGVGASVSGASARALLDLTARGILAQGGVASATSRAKGTGVVERTPDGRYVVIDGRRWRATDPEVPEDVAAELRRRLMAARRAVGAALRAQDPEAERVARAGVQRAKTALGERGTPWWEQSPEERRERWEAGLEDAPGDRP